MLDAILPSSISELWDRNRPLHISVRLTEMYILEGYREQRDKIMTDFYHALDRLVTDSQMEIGVIGSYLHLSVIKG